MRAALVGECLALLLSVLLSSRAASAQLPAESRADDDDFEVTARSDTHVALFRRALLPGPSGALIDTETIVPVHEYVSIQARRLDVGPLTDGLDLEISAWSRLSPTSPRFERPLEADVQTAFATVRYGPGQARLGRQHVAGGAARFVRFDGVSVAARIGGRFDVEGYGGFTVLPRWDARPGYHHLGSEALDLLRDRTALPEPERSGYWLSGARFGYRSRILDASASFHEQRDGGELARRNLGLDAHARAGWSSLNVSAILDTDSLRLADARLWARLEPAAPLSLSIEYLHTEPALWLSRQSVLSVFSTDRLDEAGGMATLRLFRAVSVEGASFLTLYDGHRPGARSEGTLRLLPDRRSLVRLSYVRVLAPRNGYHSLRTSLSRRLTAATSGTFEAYFYFYDRAIGAYRSSTVYAATLSQQLAAPLSLLVGGSFSRSPYSALDAQALARLSYSFDHAAGAVP